VEKTEEKKNKKKRAVLEEKWEMSGIGASCFTFGEAGRKECGVVH